MCVECVMLYLVSLSKICFRKNKGGRTLAPKQSPYSVTDLLSYVSLRTFVLCAGFSRDSYVFQQKKGLQCFSSPMTFLKDFAGGERQEA